MLMHEDGMQNFLSAAQHLTMYCSGVWVRRTAWLILTWANSGIPRGATHSMMMSTTNPTLPFLGSNMNLHKWQARN